MRFSDRLPPAALSVRVGGATSWLHPAVVEDAAALVEAIQGSLPALREFMPWAHFPQTEEVQRERLATVARDYTSGGDQIFHLREVPEGPILGSFGLHRRALNPRALEVGYWVHSSRAGRGLATLWTRCLVALCLEHYGCDRVQCCHNEANTASGRVIEKTGFAFEGRLRRYTPEPTPEMFSAGAKDHLFTRMYALFPDDRPGLPWYDETVEALTLYDADGGAHSARVVDPG